MIDYRTLIFNKLNEWVNSNASEKMSAEERLKLVNSMVSLFKRKKKFFKQVFVINLRHKEKESLVDFCLMIVKTDDISLIEFTFKDLISDFFSNVHTAQVVEVTLKEQWTTKPEPLFKIIPLKKPWKPIEY